MRQPFVLVVLACFLIPLSCAETVGRRVGLKANKRYDLDARIEDQAVMAKYHETKHEEGVKRRAERGATIAAHQKSYEENRKFKKKEEAGKADALRLQKQIVREDKKRRKEAKESYLFALDAAQKKREEESKQDHKEKAEQFANEYTVRVEESRSDKMKARRHYEAEKDQVERRHIDRDATIREEEGEKRASEEALKNEWNKKYDPHGIRAARLEKEANAILAEEQMKKAEKEVREKAEQEEKRAEKEASEKKDEEESKKLKKELHDKVAKSEKNGHLRAVQREEQLSDEAKRAKFEKERLEKEKTRKDEEFDKKNREEAKKQAWRDKWGVDSEAELKVKHAGDDSQEGEQEQEQDGSQSQK